MDKLSVNDYCKEIINGFVRTDHKKKFKLWKTYDYKLDFKINNCKSRMIYAYTENEDFSSLFDELKLYCDEHYESVISAEDKTLDEKSEGITCIFLITE